MTKVKLITNINIRKGTIYFSKKKKKIKKKKDKMLKKTKAYNFGNAPSSGQGHLNSISRMCHILW